MKIIDILNKNAENGTHCLSFEYYPPKSRENWPEFYQKIARMRALHPNFIDITWGTGDPTSLATLEIAKNIQNQSDGIETMMHITCTHRSRRELLDILSHVKNETTIRNIMALRGNRPADAPWTPHPDGFHATPELVEAMRRSFGDTFSIAVAGYPEGHREDGLPPDHAFIGSKKYFEQIGFMRQKIDAGADFIVTQLCFDLEQLCRYRDDCRKAGIHVPVIPGILPVHSRKTWEKIAAFSASIPEDIARQYDTASQMGDDALGEFAIGLLARQFEFLHKHGFNAVHLYTLNHERLISRALAKNIPKTE